MTLFPASFQWQWTLQVCCILTYLLDASHTSANSLYTLHQAASLCTAATFLLILYLNISSNMARFKAYKKSIPEGNEK